jgi:hypothetical protein
MTKEQTEQDVAFLKKLFEDKGFIFTENMMTCPVALGCYNNNNIIDQRVVVEFDKSTTIALEASTFYLNYRNIYDYTVTHQTFINGPSELIKRFSLHTLNYQNAPGLSDEIYLVGFRGAFW